MPCSMYTFSASLTCTVAIFQKHFQHVCMSVALPLRHQKTTMGEKSEGHAGCLSFLIIFTGKRPTQQTQDSDLLKTKIFH